MSYRISHRVFRFYLACFHMLSHSLHTVCGLVKLTCQSLDAGDYAEMDRSIALVVVVCCGCAGAWRKNKILKAG